MDSLNHPEFDPGKFYLGRLCIRGHDFRETGKSLRYRKTWICVECSRLYGQDPKRRQRKAETSKAYYEAHKAEQQATARQRHWKNRDKNLQNAKKRYGENPEYYSAKNKRWHRENRERRKAWAREYHTKNREQIRLSKRLWSQTDRGSKWLQANRARRKARLLGSHDSSFSQSQYVEHVKLFGDECAYCGSTKRITLDHFIPVVRGGSNVLSNIVPACHSCNSSKNASDPYEWYSKQEFFSDKQWQRILQLLGKNQGNYNQIPLL